MAQQLDTAPLLTLPDFRALFESAPGLYLVLTPNFTIAAVSNSYLRATMTRREQIIGRMLFDVFPDNPDDPDATGVQNLRASLNRVLQHGVADTMPVQKYDIRRPDSEGGAFEERYWNPVNSPVFGPDGEVAYIIYHVEDVTDFVHLQQRGIEQEHRADELSARGEQIESQLFLQTQQLLDTNRKLRDANDELNRVRTELEKRVEERSARLQRVAEKLRVTLESMGDAVIVTDAEGRVTLLNPVAEWLTGWSSLDAIGVPLTDVFHIISALTRESVENPVTRVLAEGVIVGLANHTLLISRSGIERPIDDSAAPIRDAAGNVLGVVLIFRDVTERYAAEEALRRERTLLRTIIDSIPDMIFTKDESGRFDLCNQALLKFTGSASPAELVGKTVFDLFPPEQARGYHEDDLKVFTHGETVTNREELARDANGRDLWHLVIKAPLRDREGKVIGLVGISRNIQERKEAEESLRASESLFRAAFEDTNVAMVISDTANHFLRVNTAFAQLFGYTPEEMIGMAMVDITHPDDLAASHVLREKLLAGEPFFVQEKRYRHRDGHTLWGITNVSLVRDAAERPLLYIGQVQDISDQKRVEGELRTSEGKFQAFFDSTTAAIGELSPDGQILSANAAFYRMFGFSHGELPGLGLKDIIHPEDLDAALAAYRRIGEGEVTAYEVDRRYRRKDGSTLWGRASLVAVPGEDGNPKLITAVVIDLTDHRRLEDQFRQSQKLEAVGRLAGGVAHDFNNLLTVINGYSDMLLSTLPLGSPYREALTAIHEAGERAAALTSQLLAFSRKAIVEPKVLDLNEVIEQSTRLLRRLVGEDIRVTTTLAAGLRFIKADPTQLEQIVLNLAINARDAMPRGGQLTIETHNVTLRAGEARVYTDLLPGRYVQLAVSDNGSGMSDEVKARIFEPFFTTKELGKGTGLGLSMVYGAVKTHGGHISVYSELGVGTTFKILLPATDESPTDSWTGEERLAPQGTETILLAEDEDSVRKFTRMTLETNGYTVLEASNGAEAIVLAERHTGPIHLLITDVVMPTIGGRELSELLKVRHPGLKILFVSGYTDDAVVRHGIVQATDAFLQKPYSPMALARKIRAILDEKM